MPVMDGFQATREILKLLHDASIKPLIAALTAYTTESFEEMSAEAGMSAFLTKPVQMNKLSEVMLMAGVIN